MYVNEDLPSYEARQRMIFRMLHKDAKDEKWVTLKNGVHICLDLNGNITKGPDELQGQNISYLGGKEYVPLADGYANLNTDRHIQHAKELGCKNQTEYGKMAVEFFNNGEGEVYYTEIRDRNGSNGYRFYLYNEAKGLLCVCDSYGTVKTFFKLSKARFEKIKKQDKLK